MAKIGDRITKKALELLRETPAGIPRAVLVRQISASDNKLKLSSIKWHISHLAQKFPHDVYKPPVACSVWSSIATQKQTS